LGVVAPEEAQGPPADLRGLLDLVADDMGAVNRIILDKAVSDVALIQQLAHHLIDSGGKRLRPMLTIAAAKLCGYQGSAHVQLAAAVEFMHTATLLHDDVVDDSDFRRGRKTARLVWGNPASVLVGDFLLGQAFRMMVSVGSLPALEILSNAAKTAALFSAATEVGAPIANRPAGEQDALRVYGLNLGIAFQLVDDALDYAGETARLGKATGDDFREGKITLPVILCMGRAGDQERAFWQRTLGDGKIESGDFEHAVELMGRHGAIEETLARARHYGARARDALAALPSGVPAKALADVVGFAVKRAS
jgi:octaprenyl-diphosphate synthase